MIVQHVKAIKHNNKMVDVTPAAKQHRRSTVCVSPTDTFDIITLPTPASGKAFKNIEFVNLMSKVPVGHIRAATAKAIMKHQKQYNVSLSKASIYCLMTNHANVTVISGEFTGKGRPPICSDTDLKLIAKSLEEEVGKTYNKSDVKMTIKKIETEKLERAEYKNIIKMSISDATVRNYSALLADEGNISRSHSYISKSNTWYAAENSIHGSIATL